MIDLSFVLPGLVISALLVMKGNSLGYILTPISLVFIIILAIAIAMMVFVMKARNISDESAILGVFIIFAFAGLIFVLVMFMRIKQR